MTAKKDPQKGYVALLGWSLNAIEALEKFDRRFVVVAPDWARAFAEEHDIPFMSWDFERLNDRSMEIAEKLQAEGVDVAIPLFEETVEWSGAINSVLMDNPRLYGQSVLFRDKALMKRRAQLGGIRVGIFEEAHDREDVIRFLKRVNQTLLKLDGDPNDPIHLKAFDKAGCLGHRVIRTPDEVDTIPDEEFPVLMESHLDGWEFAVEAWIHDGKIRFLNISEYVTLGYSVFVPATPDLESWRPRIEQEIEKLIKTFDLKSGFTILDTDDQIRLLKQLIKAEGLDEKRWPARQLVNHRRLLRVALNEQLAAARSVVLGFVDCMPLFLSLLPG